ncbi:MAG: toll/interleukin-1 receptor domain-containing protein [Gammaproteobacteria bacterium]|nr:toll/interleukin-1 receptor domain-containing protein [Gammaproteobacteria bacterium]
MSADESHPSPGRDVLFISKATPEDDEFVLWIAPRLEAAGYSVFADILSLEPGERWRKTLTNTLQDRAVKMLLCCRDVTLNKEESRRRSVSVRMSSEQRGMTSSSFPCDSLHISSSESASCSGSTPSEAGQGLRELLEALSGRGPAKSHGRD